MPKCATAVGALLLVTVLASPAWAQTRVPDEGMYTIGLNVGFAKPTEDGLNTGLNLGASFERYFTPRVSIRGQLSGAWFEDDVFEDTTISPMAFTGNVVYNWERGAWHPYATAGIGMYRFRLSDDLLDDVFDDADTTETRFGVNLGGGIEYFFTRRDTLLGEIQYHAIPGDMDGFFAGYDASYWSFSAGYKRYFGGR
jgi:opacity protein-like surface antigen